MKTTEIIKEINNRGGHSVIFTKEGKFISRHGKRTIKYWVVKKGKLINIERSFLKPKKILKPS